MRRWGRGRGWPVRGLCLPGPFYPSPPKNPPTHPFPPKPPCHPQTPPPHTNLSEPQHRAVNDGRPLEPRLALCHVPRRARDQLVVAQREQLRRACARRGGGGGAAARVCLEGAGVVGGWSRCLRLAAGPLFDQPTSHAPHPLPNPHPPLPQPHPSQPPADTVAPPQTTPPRTPTLHKSTPPETPRKTAPRPPTVKVDGDD